MSSGSQYSLDLTNIGIFNEDKAPTRNDLVSSTGYQYKSF